MVHLALLVRQLAGAIAGSLVDHKGRLYLDIAGFPCLVKKELLQSALQPGTLAYIERKSGSCNLDTKLPVYYIVFTSQLPVWQRARIEAGHLTAGLHHYVVLGRKSVGHIGTGSVGNRQQHVLQFCRTVVQQFLQTLCRSFQLCHTRFGGLGRLFFAILHMHGYG